MDAPSSAVARALHDSPTLLLKFHLVPPDLGVR